jgi:hypothetical protein
VNSRLVGVVDFAGTKVSLDFNVWPSFGEEEEEEEEVEEEDDGLKIDCKNPSSGGFLGGSSGPLLSIRDR